MTGTYLTLKNLLRQFVREEKWDEWLNLLPYYSDQCEEEGDWKEMYAARAKWNYAFQKTLKEPIFIIEGTDATEMKQILFNENWKGYSFSSDWLLGVPPRAFRFFHDAKHCCIFRMNADEYDEEERGRGVCLDTDCHPFGYYACFIPKELGGLL